jgi:hypothetical protein
MHNGKTLWITLISLSLCAQAFGADPRKRKAVVDTQKAELCLEERCYPVLVGKDTPKGTFDLNIVKTDPAEDYHQKHRLRRNKQLVSLAEVDFGPRWDEHLYFTKLNSTDRKGFSLSSWLKKLSPEMQKAYRIG